MSKQERIRRERPSEPSPRDRQGWTAGAGGNRGGLLWWAGGLAILVAVGAIEVESRPGQGSLFSVSFPLESRAPENGRTKTTRRSIR
jgi:hypothetical protein